MAKARSRSGARRGVATAKTAAVTTKTDEGAIPVPQAVKAASQQQRADLLVALPGGAAAITVTGTAAVRESALAWMRLVERLARSAVSPTQLLAGLEAAEDRPSSAGQLTPAELDELKAAGASHATAAEVAEHRADRSTRQIALLADALDVASAAEMLRVDPTRIRQRLRDRTLYGLRADGRTWLLPRFQFNHGQEIPHLGEVLRALPPGLHPRSVEGFLEHPQPELVALDKPTTPREWLRSGGPAAPVVALAEALAAS